MEDGIGVLVFIGILVFISFCAFKVHEQFKEGKIARKKLEEELNKPKE